MTTRKASPMRRGLIRLRNDMGLWLGTLLNESMWSKQREIAEALKIHRKVVVVGCHAPGKTWLASRWALHRFTMNTPILGVTTAPTWPQVNDVLWREMRKAFYIAESRGLSLTPKEPHKKPYWEVAPDHLMKGFASNKPENLQGLHEHKGFLIIDEGQGIEARLWPALMAMLAGKNWRALVTCNPDSATCELAKIVRQDDWHTIHISALETPNFTGEEVPLKVAESLIGPDYVEDMRRRFGEDSAIYKSKVLAQWPTSSMDSVIPDSMVTVAKLREREGDTVLSAGLDVARQGSDMSTLWLIVGNAPVELGTWSIDNHVSLARVVAQRLSDHGVSTEIPLAVDCDGMGVGVRDILATVYGYRALEFHAQAAVPSGEEFADGIKFYRNRDHSWWGLRLAVNEWMSLEGIDETVIDELLSVHYEHKAVARQMVVKVEDKDSIKSRIGRSPDRGDGIMMAVWAMTQRTLFDAESICAVGGKVDNTLCL